MTPLSPIESRVCAEIASRSERLFADLTHLVGIPTGMRHTPGLSETRELMRARLTGLGASAELVPGTPKEAWLSQADGTSSPPAPPPTLICRRRATGSNPAVLLSGHLDTVHDSASSFNSLKTSPDGKTATGPGCVDMKGGLAIALHALESLDACGVPASWGFILNSDEETGSYHSDAALRTEAAAGYAAGLALEPAMANGGLVIERPGSGQFAIEVHGRAAHVGRDFTAGVSAINSLAECVLRASKFADPDRGLIASVGLIRGGTATNVVPDFAAAWGNVRFKTESLGAEVASALDAIAKPDGTPKITVRRSFGRPAKPLTDGTRAIAELARNCAESLGQQLPFGSTGGVCDGNNLQAAGLATIDTLGVRGGGLHTPQEWIELASLVERCQLLALVIMRVTSVRV